ncbi:hypothetical protein PG985_016188 [Apiospora marii]|uniref:Uncharacterized protein n=1 Tax=Apiospora marii TaxID=335849 RepID=A0ABR1S3F4_9PEZI
MAEIKKSAGDDAVPANKVSGWEALDKHISKLQEKYEKLKQDGHIKPPNTTVQGTNSPAATEKAGKQACDSDKKST